MALNPLWQLRDRGQGVWLRHLRGRLIESGMLGELIATSAVSGVESDLQALAAAVARGDEHRTTLQHLAAGGDTEAAIEQLLVHEARLAADALVAVYEGSGHRDGFVSVGAPPLLADDAEELAGAVHRMVAAIDRPNVMIRVPPTESGFALFEMMTSDGLHVHVGPLFSIPGVERATEAFLRGVRRFLASGGREDDVAALASFGLARLDVTLDELLRELIRESEGDTSSAEALLGSCAVALAKQAARRHRQLLDHGLGAALRGAGPHMMRLMWTDVATHDPRAADTRYVESLIGADTVVSMSFVRLRTFRDEGVVDATLVRRGGEAAEILAELQGVGVDAGAAGRELEERALDDDLDAYDRLIDEVEAAAAELAGTAGAAPPDPVEIADPLVDGIGAADGRLTRRLWDKEPSLWSDDPRAEELIRNRLGWLDIVESMRVEHEPAARFARQVRDGDVEDVVLIGMGGSSLFAAACREVFGVGYFRVLDSTVPAQIRALADKIDPARTLILVASKSGTTIESRALADHFYAQATPMLESPGERFVAITDPGTPLEQLAHERGFRRLWLAPPDVGGRFSALSIFGVLPMALMGIDTGAVIESAWRMALSCAPEVELAANPGARLGFALHRAWKQGRDKLTFLDGGSLRAFAAWIEQLVAESTGKEGIGLVPVVDEPAGEVEEYGADRFFVHLRLADEPAEDEDRLADALEAAGHPVARFRPATRESLGGELFRWQFAVAVAGALMGINPFDEPDVQAAKDCTRAVLAAEQEGDELADRAPVDGGPGWTVFADLSRDPDLAARRRGEGLEGWLAAHLGRARVPDYVGLQAFIAADGVGRARLARLRALLRLRLGVATTLGWGPSYLHSTGQLHKGGPDRAVFLQITADDGEDLDCPGQPFTFGRLARAQWLGDLRALQERGRRVVRIHLTNAADGLADLLEAAERALD